jgi:hypothetical protein
MKQDDRMFLQLLQYRTFPHVCTQKNKVKLVKPLLIHTCGQVHHLARIASTL